MAFNGGLRSGIRVLISSEAAAVSKSVSRGIHSTAVKRSSAAHDDYEYYLHAKHMYNLDRMTHQGLKMSLGVLTAFSIGVGVPIFAVMFQQKKASSS